MAAGKSTSIAVLLGLCEPDGGYLQLFNQTEGDLLAVRRRIAGMPPGQVLPRGINLLQNAGEWWVFAVAADALQNLPGLWEDLIVHGWHYIEIHAEGGGLETLYLQLTTATESEMKAKAA